MKDINELLKENGNYSFDVNEWGSCQYAGALAMYNAYFYLRTKYDREAVLEYLKYEFGYEISFSAVIYDDKEAVQRYFLDYVKFRKLNISNMHDYDNLEKLDKHHKKAIKSMSRAYSADDLFFVGRNAASDLWHTAPRVCKSYFMDFTTKNLPNCENQTGLEKGPVGNLCAQSDNVLTGLCCALLVDYDIVKNTKSFSGFDT